MRISGLLLAALAVMAPASQGSAKVEQRARIEIADGRIFPENLTATPDGAVIVGSLMQPFIYRAGFGEMVARRWIDLRDVQSISYGVLADTRSRTLWACTVKVPRPGDRAPPLGQRVTSLRAFDLHSGWPKGDWPLPGDHNACNDMTLGPDGAVYASDADNRRIVRLRRGATALEVWLDDPRAGVIDGLAFLGRDLYFTDLRGARILRTRTGKRGEALALEEIALDLPLKGPDGMRVAHGRLFVADNRLNQLIELTIAGNHARGRILARDYHTLTGVAPASGGLWLSEMRAEYLSDPALRDADPGPFAVTFLPLAR